MKGTPSNPKWLLIMYLPSTFCLFQSFILENGTPFKSQMITFFTKRSIKPFVVCHSSLCYWRDTIQTPVNLIDLIFALNFYVNDRDTNQIPIDYFYAVSRFCSSVSFIFTLTNTGHQSSPNKLYMPRTYFISLFSGEFNQSTSYFNSFIFFSFDRDACQIPMSFPAIVLFYYPIKEITTS